MRKVLLATTALVGVAFGATSAHAAPAPTAPITLNVGGYVDFVAGFFSGSEGAAAFAHGSEGTLRGATHDFETEFKLNFDAVGKASNGIEYGANVSLWNGSEVTDFFAPNGGTSDFTPFTGGTNRVTVNSAYVWLSGSFGKALFGDEHGASDLFVYAPTVGEGQVDGRYMDFTDPFVLARFQPSGIDNTEHSTKITYYTPKVGNEDHKVQAGVSYTPNLYDYGQNVIKQTNPTGGQVNGQNNSVYQDVIEADLQYTGKFSPVNVVASAQFLTGDGGHTRMNATGLGQGNAGNTGNLNGRKGRDFTAWGVGAQATYAGFTAGGSYVDMGRYNTVNGQNSDQRVFTLGGKYEMDKVAVAANWLNGQGYDNQLLNSGGNTVGDNNYVPEFNAYGAGATYTWFPGLTSAIDGVWYTQKNRGMFQSSSATEGHDDGYVIMLSQKMTF